MREGKAGVPRKKIEIKTRTIRAEFNQSITRRDKFAIDKLISKTLSHEKSYIEKTVVSFGGTDLFFVQFA